jgi:hypothetical protein
MILCNFNISLYHHNMLPSHAGIKFLFAVKTNVNTINNVQYTKFKRNLTTFTRWTLYSFTAMWSIQYNNVLWGISSNGSITK